MVKLGNIDAKRDWGHARDYVHMMWMMLQQEKPDDYVVATGEQYSVREFCVLAFQMAGMDIEWVGEGVNEQGVEKTTRRVLVSIDPRYFRPAEVETLLGDPTKARVELGWVKEVNFPQLVYDMMLNDFRRAGLTLPPIARELAGNIPKWMEDQVFIEAAC